MLLMCFCFVFWLVFVLFYFVAFVFVVLSVIKKTFFCTVRCYFMSGFLFLFWVGVVLGV